VNASNMLVDTNLTGVVSAVEVDQDPSDVPTDRHILPPEELENIPLELRMCTHCGETPCEWIEFKDQVLDVVSNAIFNEYDPAVDQIGEDVVIPLDDASSKGSGKWL